MDLQEYKRQINELQKECDRRKYMIAKEYALSNNPYKIGDVFKDHIGSIKIEEISVSVIYGEPSCIYKGAELKKDGTPNKKGLKRQAYQSNEEK